MGIGDWEQASRQRAEATALERDWDGEGTGSRVSQKCAATVRVVTGQRRAGTVAWERGHRRGHYLDVAVGQCDVRGADRMARPGRVYATRAGPTDPA